MTRSAPVDLPSSLSANSHACESDTHQSGHSWSRRRSVNRLLVHDHDVPPAIVDALWDDADGVISGGEMLKDGDRCTVVRATLGGRDVVIKRYNLRGPMHTTGHLLIRSRARWSWLNGHRLRKAGVPSPRPLAYMEERWGSLRGRSMIVNAYLQGRTLLELVKSGELDDERLRELASQFARIWHELGRLRAGHGDMKANNFIIDENWRMWVVDLDAMRLYRRGVMFRRRRGKDLARFMRNWQSHPRAAAVFRASIDTAATPGE